MCETQRIRIPHPTRGYAPHKTYAIRCLFIVCGLELERYFICCCLEMIPSLMFKYQELCYLCQLIRINSYSKATLILHSKIDLHVQRCVCAMLSVHNKNQLIHILKVKKAIMDAISQNEVAQTDNVQFQSM